MSWLIAAIGFPALALLSACGSNGPDATEVTKRLDAKLPGSAEGDRGYHDVKCVSAEDEQFLCRVLVTMEMPESLPINDDRAFFRCVERQLAQKGSDVVVSGCAVDKRARDILKGRRKLATKTIRGIWFLYVKVGERLRIRPRGGPLPYPVPAVIRRELPPAWVSPIPN